MSKDRDSSPSYHDRQELGFAGISNSFSSSSEAPMQSPSSHATEVPRHGETSAGDQQKAVRSDSKALATWRERSPSPAPRQLRQIAEEVGRSQKLLQEHRQRQEVASIWKSKYEAVLASAEQKEAEIARLMKQLNSATTAADELRSLLREEIQKNWELQYDLQDAESEVRALREQLMNSIPVRFQGGSGDEDNDNDVEAGLLGGLPWEKYESSRITDLKEELRRVKRDVAIGTSSQ
ncbi:uncharacterized protein B0T15DRAFT_215117 [Chaetomium strumarium]|uniref:Uncharacterized protein n=1 Tax=Chaetomium strumarium TaxID=1170767 RepID=A0AAJ0GTM1_9PEZI|nr:hypothetical protein B0T15DRAFT_215117 [Chaetomium strumarium]